MSILNNTALLNSLLEQANALPDAVQAENLDAEIAVQNAIIAEQDAKIAELAEVLAGKAGGSSETINTCNVTVRRIGLPITNFFTIAFTESEGIFPLTNDIQGLPETFALQKVVCGSIIALYTFTPVVFGYTTTGGATLIYQKNQLCVFSIPQQPTGDITITIREDD